MKKTLVILLVAVLAVSLFVSCKSEPDSGKKGYTGDVYEIGATGPGGGTVFYDVDADNDTGNADGLKADDCGWRYLEALKSDIDFNDQTKFYFGYNRTTADGQNNMVGTIPEAGGDKIGAGKDNTDKLIAAMGPDAAFQSENGSDKCAYYAASIIYYFNSLEHDQFGKLDDWFLPSKEEALKMVSVLNLTSNYWTSTESDNFGSKNAYAVSTKGIGEVSKATAYAVRAVRRF